MTHKRKLIPKERIMPRETKVVDSVAERRLQGYNRRQAPSILLEAQGYWMAMADFRQRRARNKRYTYGDQWKDLITVDGVTQTEEQYIISQGNVPLKNNLIRRLVNQVIGVFRKQTKEPTCVARDRDEQRLGETMSSILQYNMQLNRMNDLLARSLEEFLISGIIVHRKSFGWRNEKMDCWTDYVNPNNFFVDTAMKDFRGSDITCIGEIHDISPEELLASFATTPAMYQELLDLYSQARNRDHLQASLSGFGSSGAHEDISFYVPRSPRLCRVIEVWRKETKARYRCHDTLNGDFYKIDIADYKETVQAENESRLKQGRDSGMSDEDIPLIEAEWFIDTPWHFYFLTPTGYVLSEGETPYEHKSYPYVFKMYPFIDGEIHPFVGNFIDQQRYVNRLITLHDWVIRASAKGVLLFPEEALPDDMTLEEVADEWSRFNGVIAIKTKGGIELPRQISTNSTQIGIGELLHLQMNLFEEISGVHGALQGKPGHAHMSASLYAQQTQNATTSLVDILDTFSSFIQDGAYKDVKNIQQYYDKKRVFNIAGQRATEIVYDPKKIRDVEFDLSIVESTSTPAYRQTANEFLVQIWQAQQISLEQLLEHGDFPFADELLQSIKSQREAMEAQQSAQQQMPSGGGALPSNITQQMPQANPQAMAMLNQYMQ